MTMRLAPEAIQIVHGGNTVRLQPSLRAAYRLDHRHGSFGHIMHGLQQMNIAIIGDILAETATDATAARRLLIAKVDQHGVAELGHLLPSLFDLLAACYGVEPEEEHPAERRERITGKPFSMRRALEDAFAIATGWLGYTPDEALSATPSQIIAAHRGHVAKLRALNGQSDSSDDAASDLLNLPSDDEVKEGIAKLKEIAKR